MRSSRKAASSSWRSRGAGALDPVDEVGLTRAGVAGEQVDQGVGVGGDEVDRRVAADAVVAHRVRDGRPPAAGQARIGGLRATEHPDAQRQVGLGDLAEAARERGAPRLLEPLPVVDRAAEDARALVGTGEPLRPRPADRAQLAPQLVPLDLVGDECRDEVVDVGGRGEQDAPLAVGPLVPLPSPRGRLGGRPVGQRQVDGGELLLLLAHDHDTALVDARGKPLRRVQERAEVEILRTGERMQRGLDRDVRRLQDPQLRLTRDRSKVE